MKAKGLGKSFLSMLLALGLYMAFSLPSCSAFGCPDFSSPVFLRRFMESVVCDNLNLLPQVSGLLVHLAVVLSNATFLT